MAKLQGMAKRDARSTRIAATVFLFPAVALLIVYMIYPIIETFRISELKWNGFYTAEKINVGFDNWTALIQDVTIRSKASVILAILVVIINFIPFFTYLTPEDARIREEQERKAKEFRRQQKEAAEMEVAEQARQAQDEAKEKLQ